MIYFDMRYEKVEQINIVVTCFELTNIIAIFIV
jgi:hypothetical protein